MNEETKTDFAKTIMTSEATVAAAASAALTTRSNGPPLASLTEANASGEPPVEKERQEAVIRSSPGIEQENADEAAAVIVASSNGLGEPNTEPLTKTSASLAAVRADENQDMKKPTRKMTGPETTREPVRSPPRAVGMPPAALATRESLTGRKKATIRKRPPAAGTTKVPHAPPNPNGDFLVVNPPSLFANNDTKDAPPATPTVSSLLTDQDLLICQRLDEEYERALEEREIGYNARYDSVRQSAALSIVFMFLYMTLGTVFFTQAAGWEVHEALFFSIYTITTVGYGSDKSIPKTPGFQIYTIFYIFVGIATLTIMVAQVYQCISLEASRAQHRRDRAELAGRSKDLVNGDGIMKSSSHHSSNDEQAMQRKSSSEQMMEWWSANVGSGETWVDKCIRAFERTKHFLRDTQSGRAVSSLLPFGGLILIGAIVVGPIEGWTVVESLYFACVSLTTVGYGDTIPRRQASIWFCIFWLPFSVGFMSLFLTNVARFYIRLSDKNIQRIEGTMRRRLQMAKLEAEKERAAVLRRAYRFHDNGAPSGASSEVAMGNSDEDTLKNEETSANSMNRLSGKSTSSRKSLAKRVAHQFGFEPLPDQEATQGGSDESEQNMPVGSPEALEILGQLRRERILKESTFDVDGNPRVDDVTTMGDMLRTVRENVVTESDVGQSYGDTKGSMLGRPGGQFMSIKSNDLMSRATVRRRALAKSEKKPSFALRVLVQERFAEIIATEVAGFQSSFGIEDNTLSVTIETLHRTVEKWLVPRRARRAFRTVAFEAIHFVGEHSLITRGATALYALSPFEFHGLFAPLLASLGDAETMEGWLASTNILADVDLRRNGSGIESGARGSSVSARRDSTPDDTGDEDCMTVRRRSIT